MDIIWDFYKSDSLKGCTREGGGGGGGGGEGIHEEVGGHMHVKLPRNFQDFLRDENKKEL